MDSGSDAGGKLFNCLGEVGDALLQLTNPDWGAGEKWVGEPIAKKRKSRENVQEELIPWLSLHSNRGLNLIISTVSCKVSGARRA